MRMLAVKGIDLAPLNPGWNNLPWERLEAAEHLYLEPEAVQGNGLLRAVVPFVMAGGYGNNEETLLLGHRTQAGALRLGLTTPVYPADVGQWPASVHHPNAYCGLHGPLEHYAGDKLKPVLGAALRCLLAGVEADFDIDLSYAGAVDLWGLLPGQNVLALVFFARYFDGLELRGKGADPLPIRKLSDWSLFPGEWEAVTGQVMPLLVNIDLASGG